MHKKPLHELSSKFISFWKKLSSYKELEERMESVYPSSGVSKVIQGKNNKIKGDLKEIFAEGFLVAHMKYQEVLPSNAISASLKKSLGLHATKKDTGVDGIFKGEDGQWTAYQVKYTTNHKKNIPYTGKGGLASFFDSSKKFPQRCVFTNAHGISDTPNGIHDNWYSFTRDSVENLTTAEFKNIIKFLVSGSISICNKKILPKPHQTKALNSIKKYAKKHDRMQIIMACGTGKTFISVRAAIACGAKKIVILVPSIELLGQTRREFMRLTGRYDYRMITVCSRKDLHNKDCPVSVGGLSHPITTEEKQLKLNIKDAEKFVIFSTYKSSHVLGKALKDTPLDFGIFDEAHHTAGRVEKQAAFALTESNLKIKKRLFLTATPSDWEGDSSEYNSMDNLSVYGPVCYSLSFSEAVKKGIILPWKILVSVLTKEDVQREILKTGEVTINGSSINPQQVAGQIGLAKAIKKFNLNKGITYHGSIPKAISYASEEAEGIKTHIGKAFTALSLHSNQSSSVQNSNLKEFANSKKAVISTVNKLNEGIDVPNVDFVAFMDPILSTRNIVQRGGRPIRVCPESNKKVGYIHLNIYVEQNKGETVREALDRTGYGHIDTVLRAMSQEDDSLHALLVNAAIDFGRGQSLKGYGQRLVDDRIDFILESIPLSDLQAGVSAVALRDSLDDFNISLGRYLKEESKLNDLVNRSIGPDAERQATRSDTKNSSFARSKNHKCPYSKKTQKFIREMRKRKANMAKGKVRKMKSGTYRCSVLTKAEFKALDSAPNWFWSEQDAINNYMIKLIPLFVEKYGHGDVFSPNSKGSRELEKDSRFNGFITWYNNIRLQLTPTSARYINPSNGKESTKIKIKDLIQLKKAILKAGGVLRTEYIGNKKWSLSYQRLVNLYEGELKKDWSLLKSTTYPADYGWYKDQCENFKNGKLAAEQIAAMKKIKLSLEMADSPRIKRLQEKFTKEAEDYKKWRDSKSLLDRKDTSDKENTKWNKWASRQRGNHNTGSLSDFRTKTLKRIDFDFTPELSDVSTLRLEKNIEKMLAHHKKYGTYVVEISHNDQRLRRWRHKTRSRITKGDISENHFKLIKKRLGREFFMDHSIDMIKQYKKYTKEFGFKDLPPVGSETLFAKMVEKKYSGLTQWAAGQISAFQNGEMSKERMSELVMLKFPLSQSAQERKSALKKMEKAHLQN